MQHLNVNAAACGADLFSSDRGAGEELGLIDAGCHSDSPETRISIAPPTQPESRSRRTSAAENRPGVTRLKSIGPVKEAQTPRNLTPKTAFPDFAVRWGQALM